MAKKKLDHENGVAVDREQPTAKRLPFPAASSSRTGRASSSIKKPALKQPQAAPPQDVNIPARSSAAPPLPPKPTNLPSSSSASNRPSQRAASPLPPPKPSHLSASSGNPSLKELKARQQAQKRQQHQPQQQQQQQQQHAAKEPQQHRPQQQQQQQQGPPAVRHVPSSSSTASSQAAPLLPLAPPAQPLTREKRTSEAAQLSPRRTAEIRRRWSGSGSEADGDAGSGMEVEREVGGRDRGARGAGDGQKVGRTGPTGGVGARAGGRSREAASRPTDLPFAAPVPVGMENEDKGRAVKVQKGKGKAREVVQEKETELLASPMDVDTTPKPPRPAHTPDLQRSTTPTPAVAPKALSRLAPPPTPKKATPAPIAAVGAKAPVPVPALKIGKEKTDKEKERAVGAGQDKDKDKEKKKKQKEGDQAAEASTSASHSRTASTDRLDSHSPSQQPSAPRPAKAKPASKPATHESRPVSPHRSHLPQLRVPSSTTSLHLMDDAKRFITNMVLEEPDLASREQTRRFLAQRASLYGELGLISTGSPAKEGWVSSDLAKAVVAFRLKGQRSEDLDAIAVLLVKEVGRRANLDSLLGLGIMAVEAEVQGSEVAEVLLSAFDAAMTKVSTLAFERGEEDVEGVGTRLRLLPVLRWLRSVLGMSSGAASGPGGMGWCTEGVLVPGLEGGRSLSLDEIAEKGGDAFQKVVWLLTVAEEVGFLQGMSDAMRKKTARQLWVAVERVEVGRGRGCFEAQLVAVKQWLLLLISLLDDPHSNGTHDIALELAETLNARLDDAGALGLISPWVGRAWVDAVNVLVKRGEDEEVCDEAVRVAEDWGEGWAGVAIRLREVVGD